MKNCKYNIKNLHEKILKRAGLEHLRLHDLRHPYVKPATKNIICKSRNPKLPFPITWGFCFTFLMTDSFIVRSIAFPDEVDLIMSLKRFSNKV